jgi:predicted site-specific integrase-resolvase
MDDRLLRSSEVAALFRVDPKTVWQWGVQGQLDRVRTPGGQWRYKETQVRQLLAASVNGTKSEITEGYFMPSDYSSLTDD